MPKKFLFQKNISITYLLVFLGLIITTLNDLVENDEEDYQVGYLKFDFEVSNQMIIAPLKIGTPDQEIKAILDIGSKRAWISPKTFDTSKSSSYVDKEVQRESIKQYDYSYWGKPSTETFSFGNTKLTNFNFLLVDEYQNAKLSEMNGALSLGHKYDSNHNSLIYEMNRASNTAYNMFIFHFKEENKGEFLIGDSNEVQKRKNQYINKCFLLNGGTVDDQIKWRCEVSHMFIGGIEDLKTYKDKNMEQTGYYISKTKTNNLIDVKQPAVFETIFDEIFVPRKILEYLRDNYFIDTTDGTSLCDYKDFTDRAKISCPKDVISKLKTLNFVLSEKTALAFPPSSLLSCSNDKCEFLVKSNSNYEGFIFGIPVFKLYDITFDYKEQDLIFYSKSNKYLVKLNSDSDNSKLPKFALILIIVFAVMLIGLAIFCFIRYKNKKTKEAEEKIPIK